MKPAARGSWKDYANSSTSFDQSNRINLSKQVRFQSDGNENPLHKLSFPWPRFQLNNDLFKNILSEHRTIDLNISWSGYHPAMHKSELIKTLHIIRAIVKWWGGKWPRSFHQSNAKFETKKWYFRTCFTRAWYEKFETNISWHFQRWKR